MKARQDKHVIYTAVVIGILLSLGAATGYLLSGPTSQETPSSLQILCIELFKAALTFTLIAAGGGYIKIVGDRFLEGQRIEQAQLDKRKAERRSIIDELVNTFSGFYSLRKYYESKSQPRDAEFVKYFLEKSTELEGRFGALKVRAIQHFKLPEGVLRSQEIEGLNEDLKAATEKSKVMSNSPEAARQEARIRLDLLGQFYDKWRHALEKEREKILLSKKEWEKILSNYHRDDLESHWEQYRKLLTFFEESPLEEDSVFGKAADAGVQEEADKAQVETMPDATAQAEKNAQDDAEAQQQQKEKLDP
jgi:hypothetical protein